MDIFEEVKKLGIPWDCHESDLYIPVNEQTKALIEQYQHKSNVTTFVSNTDKTLWYDIPFAYSPWWEQRQAKTPEPGSP